MRTVSDYQQLYLGIGAQQRRHIGDYLVEVLFRSETADRNECFSGSKTVFFEQLLFLLMADAPGEAIELNTCRNDRYRAADLVALLGFAELVRRNDKRACGVIIAVAEPTDDVFSYPLARAEIADIILIYSMAGDDERYAELAYHPRCELASGELGLNVNYIGLPCDYFLDKRTFSAQAHTCVRVYRDVK